MYTLDLDDPLLMDGDEGCAFAQRTDDVTRLWILRALVMLGGADSVVGVRCIKNEALARGIGLPTVHEDKKGKYDAERVHKELRRMLEAAEKEKGGPVAS